MSLMHQFFGLAMWLDIRMRWTIEPFPGWTHKDLKKLKIKIKNIKGILRFINGGPPKPSNQTYSKFPTPNQILSPQSQIYDLVVLSNYQCH